MALSMREQRFIRRVAGYGINPVTRQWRVWRSLEQTHLIGGHPVVLPPSHDLPFFQRRDPTYDTYAADLLRELADGQGRMLVIDIGANVGDTAVEALAAAANIEVIAVEGDPNFASYARRNLEQFADRARVVEGFVGPAGPRYFRADGTTGGFRGSEADGTEVTEWIAPATLLTDAPSFDEVVWKSDIDGYDVHVLTQHWEDITAACHTLWFEFDPIHTLGDRTDVVSLIDLLAESGRELRVFDNLGREMVRLSAGTGVRDGLTTINNWLWKQPEGHVAVPYVDIWAR